MADDLQELIDELAALLAGMPVEQQRSWLLGLCRRLDDQAGGGAVFDRDELWHELRDRRALGRWAGTGKLWGSNAPQRDASNNDV